MKRSLNWFSATALVLALSTPAEVLAGDYPTAINSRPLTLPGGTWALAAGLTTEQTTPFFGDPFWLTRVDLGFDYAISNGLQLGLRHPAVVLSPEFDVMKAIELGADFSIYDEDSLAIAAAVDVPLFFAEGVELVQIVRMSAPTRVNLMAGKLSIHTGDELIVYDRTFGLHLVEFTLPLGLSYQVSDSMNIRLDTELVSALAVLDSLDDVTITSLADASPVDLALVHSRGCSIVEGNKIDVGISMNIGDAQNAADTLGIRLGLVYYGL